MFLHIYPCSHDSDSSSVDSPNRNLGSHLDSFVSAAQEESQGFDAKNRNPVDSLHRTRDRTGISRWQQTRFLSIPPALVDSNAPRLVDPTNRPLPRRLRDSDRPSTLHLFGTRKSLDYGLLPAPEPCAAQDAHLNGDFWSDLRLLLFCDMAGHSGIYVTWIRLDCSDYWIVNSLFTAQIALFASDLPIYPLRIVSNHYPVIRKSSESDDSSWKRV